MADGSIHRLEATWAAARELAGITRIADVESALPTLRHLFEADVLVCRWGPNTPPTAVCGAFGDARTHPLDLKDDPQLSYMAELPPGTRVIPTTRLVGRHKVRKSVAYEVLYRPNGVDELMSAYFTDSPPLASGFLGLGLGRPHPFTEEDERNLQTLLPFFSAMERRSRRLERLELCTSSLSSIVEQRSSHPLIVVTIEGDILWQSGAAKRLLRQATGSDAELPEEVRESIRHCKQRGKILLPAACGTFSLGARTIAFDLQPLPGAGELGPLLVELMPDAERPLTRAEHRVLRHLRQGRSLGEVARTLGVSLETVRTHTRNIYRKYGVASRAELLAARSF